MYNKSEIVRTFLFSFLNILSLYSKIKETKVSNIQRWRALVPLSTVGRYTAEFGTYGVEKFCGFHASRAGVENTPSLLFNIQFA